MQCNREGKISSSSFLKIELVNELLGEWVY